MKKVTLSLVCLNTGVYNLRQIMGKEIYKYGEKEGQSARIPLPKNAVDKDAIIEEAMKDDMAHGWLLVASALSDLGYDNISELSDAVNR